MAVTVKNIIPRKRAEAIPTGQYTALNCRAVIDKFTVTNTTPGVVTFTANLVASGVSVDDSNKVLSRGIAAGETYTCPELVGQVLEDGGFISTTAGVAASLTISASGREIT